MPVNNFYLYLLGTRTNINKNDPITRHSHLIGDGVINCQFVRYKWFRHDTEFGAESLSKTFQSFVKYYNKFLHGKILEQEIVISILTAYIYTYRFYVYDIRDWHSRYISRIEYLETFNLQLKRFHNYKW